MRHEPLLLSQRIRSILNKQAVVIFHVILSSVIVFDVIIEKTTYTSGELLGIFTALGIFVLLGVFRFFNAFGINERPFVYVSVYHMVFAVAFGLFAPAYSPYLYMWLVLLYIANFYFGKTGSLLSGGLFFLTLLYMSFRVLDNTATTLEYFYFVATQLVLFISIAYFFIRTDSVSDQDRKVFLVSIDKAQLERQRLTALINSMGDGVISTDDKGAIKLYNAAALSVLDTNGNLQDKNIREVIKLIDKSAKVVDIMHEVTKKNAPISTDEYLMVYPDGEKINVYINIAPIKLSFRQNTERGYIISFRDITREKSLEEERNEFISVVSHELRTPIAITEANISNAKFIVEKGTDVKPVKAALEAAHKQSMFLASMINDLSTLSRAERGQLDMVIESISPREIIKSLEDDYRKEAETKGLELSTQVDEGTPEAILSNRLYVREILQNFITNSIKYTKKGSVTVSVRPATGGIEFDVQDTGIGISKSDQKRVFDKFFRSEDFRTRESSGTGLGLYITKKLMKLIHGEIDVKSKLNEGSTFTIFVPDLKKEDTDKLDKV